MGLLEGKTVVFTGAGAGIGREVVRHFVGEGARVVAVDLSPAVTGLPDELGDAVLPIVGDVSDPAVNQSAVDTAVSAWGKLDVFAGNAGVYDGAKPLEEIELDTLPAAFGELMGVNVLAPLLGVRAALPHLIASRGCVILTGSFATYHASGGGVLYTASKHAVLGLVRQLAYEFAPDVRVNGIAPGVAPTKLRGVGALGQEPADSVLDGTAAALPTQEVPALSDFNGVFTLLASDQSRAMTGTMVPVDSGLGIRGLARPGGRVGR